MSAVVNAFQRVVEPFLPDWAALEVRAVGVRDREGAWRIMCAKIALLDAPATNQYAWDDESRIEGLLMARRTLPASHLPAVLQQLAQGFVAAGPREIALPKSPSVPVPTYRAEGTRGRSGHTAGFRLLSEIGFSDLIPDETFERIDAELRAADPPWDGLADVREHYVGLAWGSHMECGVEVEAPLRLAIDECRIDADGRLRVRVAAGARLVTDAMRLSVIADAGDGSFHRESLPGARGRRDGGTMHAETHVPTTTRRCTVLLCYRGIEVDRAVVGEPEPSVEATAEEPRDEPAHPATARA